jgi:hypothetical protein
VVLSMGQVVLVLVLVVVLVLVLVLVVPSMSSELVVV